MNYYEHHLGDYLRDTVHLSMIEDAAYRRLLDAYYVRERPLPSDPRECCKLARAMSRAERDAVLRVLEQFFRLEDDGFHQRRADAEIERFQDKQRKARASADARWSATRPQSGGNADADANAYANASGEGMRTHGKRICESDAPHVHARTRARARPQSPVTSHQEEKTPPLRGAPPAASPRVSPEPMPERPADVTEQTWADWVALRKEKKAKVSVTALRGAEREAAKLGWTLEAFLAEWCVRGSQGLKAEWIAPQDRQRFASSPAGDRVGRQLRTAALMVNPPEEPGTRKPAEPVQEVIDVTARRIG